MESIAAAHVTSHSKEVLCCLRAHGRAGPQRSYMHAQEVDILAAALRARGSIAAAHAVEEAASWEESGGQRGQ